MTKRSCVKTRVLAMLVAIPLLFQSACGTILYPERRGQTEGRIDPAVAIMNGVGLLLFVIPGLVAFAIDFSTGAIYLPPDEANRDGEPRVVHLDLDEITPEKLKALLREHTGREITLTERELHVLEQGHPDSAKRSVSRFSRMN